MNVSLTPQLEKMVKQKVASGRYSSASEVIREALRLMERQQAERAQRLKELRREIQVGLDQVARGEYTELETEADIDRFFDDLDKHVRQTARARRIA